MVMMILMGGLERKGEYNAKYFYLFFSRMWKKGGGSIGWAFLNPLFSFSPSSSDSCVRLIAIFMSFKAVSLLLSFLTCESRANMMVAGG